MSAKAKAFKNLYIRRRITADAVRQAGEDGVLTAEEVEWVLEG